MTEKRAEIKIGRMVLGSCQTNCYFLYRTGNGDVIVIDPADNGEQIYNALARNGFSVKGILLTHGHFDHIWGCKALKAAAERGGDEELDDRGASAAECIKVYACETEKELLGNARMNVSDMAGRPYTMNADVYVKDGDELTIADMKCKVLATPGHTAGGCCYYFEEAGFLLCGDTIFRESVGRTDFPTGSMSTLVRSIREKIFTLPEDTKLYPGHGEETTVEYEKKYNPFLG